MRASLRSVLNQGLTQVNVGAGVNAIFTPSDAIFAALAARQVVRSTQADLVTTINDTTLAVATAYFNAQQARGELFGALDTVRQADRLVLLTEKLANEGKGKEGGLVLPLEITRARAEQPGVSRRCKRPWKTGVSTVRNWCAFCAWMRRPASIRWSRRTSWSLWSAWTVPSTT